MSQQTYNQFKGGNVSGTAVQSDWAQTDPSSDSFIKNKPNIDKGRIHKLGLWAVDASDPSPKPDEYWIVDLESPNNAEPSGYDRLTVSKAVEIHNSGAFFGLRTEHVQNPYEDNLLLETYFEYVAMSQTFVMKLANINNSNESSEYTLDSFGDYVGVSLVDKRNLSLGKLHRISVRSVQAGDPSPKPQTDWIIDLESPNPNEPDGYDRLSVASAIEIHKNGEVFAFASSSSNADTYYESLFNSSPGYVHMTLIRSGFHQRPNEVSLVTVDGYGDYLGISDAFQDSEYWNVTLLSEDGNGSDVTVDFTEAQTRTNIATGSKFSVLFGTIKKWFTDLKALAFKDKADLTQDVSGILPIANGGTNASTVADARTNLDVYSKAEVNTAIDTAVSSAYHAAGTKTVAQLTNSLLVAANLGNVYNITDSGTTTADFVDGAGHPIKAGDNVGIFDVGGGVYRFDLLSGFVDLSGYKAKQTAVTDPTADGDGLSFLDSASQNTNGEVTLHKKKVQDGTTSQKGVVQLEDSVSSTATDKAATPNSVKTAYDLISSKANDADVVHKADAETIGGIKTFRNNHSSRYVSPTYGLCLQSVMMPFTNIKPYNQWTAAEQDGNHYRVWSIDVTSVVPSSMNGTFIVDFAGTYANENSNGWIRKEIFFSTYINNLVNTMGDYTIAETPASNDFVVSNLIKEGTRFYLKIATKIPTGDNYPQMFILTLREGSSTLTLKDVSMSGAIVDGWPSWAGDKNTPVKVTASGSPVLTEATAATVARTGSYNDLANKPLVYWSSQYDAALVAVSDGIYDFSIAWPTGIDTTKNYILEVTALFNKDASELSQLNGDDLPFHLSLITTGHLALGTCGGVMTSIRATTGDYYGNTSLMTRITSSMLTGSTLVCHLAFPNNILTLADTFGFTVRLRFTEAP